MPAASMFESAAYDRLGQHHLANRNQETVRYAYGSCAPAGDRVRALCRTAYTTTQNGKCAAGLKILEEAMPQARGSLKLEQRVQAFVILVQLLRSLKRLRRSILLIASANMPELGMTSIQLSIS